MDKVEKAVIDLDGDNKSQPDGSYKSPTWDQLVRLPDGRLSWCGVDSDHYRDGALICNQSEFMEARKRLENKPEWGFWAKYRAQDSQGYWHRFEHKPTPGAYNWISESGQYCMCDPGHVFGDWRQSLEPRPQPDNKEGEGVGWDEDGSFPPGGDRCEAYIMADARNQHGPAGKWVVGISRGKAVASNGGWGGIFEADDGVMHFVGAQSYFRPIQSHRDKVIEAAREFFTNLGFCPNDRQLGKAFDSGLLKLPEGEE